MKLESDRSMLMRYFTMGFSMVGALLLFGCRTSPSASAELDTPTRLSAIEIRLSQIDDRLAVIQAYQTGTYVVRRADTPTIIANLLGLTQTNLAKMNPDVEWNRLRVGQHIPITAAGEPNKPMQPTTR